MGVVFFGTTLAHALGATGGGLLLNLLGFRPLFVAIGLVVLLLSAAGIRAGARSPAREGT